MINHLIWCHITLHISLKELKGCSFVLLVVKIQHGSHVLYWEIIKLINNHSSKNNSRNYLDKIISKQRHAYVRLETSLLLFCLPCAKHNWICLPWLACSCGWKSEEERERAHAPSCWRNQHGTKCQHLKANSSQLLPSSKLRDANQVKILLNIWKLNHKSK